MKKKILSLFLTGALALSMLTGCGSAASTNADAVQEEVQEEVQETEDTAESEETDAEVSEDEATDDSEIQKYLLKEKLSYDIITVNTEYKYENTDNGNADGGKDDYQ